MNAETETTGNPFGTGKQVAASGSTAVEQGRAMQEVQAMVLVAHKAPRDQRTAMDKILQTCTRKTLAESAIYTYPRGGTQVEGPSIRLAEAIAQNWQNISFGIRELSQTSGVSEVEAFAWDLETNVRQSKTFHVKHERYSRNKGNTALTDPRDIYEMVANQGARRLRACILGVIPGDVIDAAVGQCKITQQQSVDASPEAIEKMVNAFGEFGVQEGHIIKRLGHRMDVTTAAEVINLKRVYQSIRDGMAPPSQYFEIEGDPTAQSAETRDLNEKLKKSEKTERPKRWAKKAAATEDKPEAKPETGAQADAEPATAAGKEKSADHIPDSSLQALSRCRNAMAACTDMDGLDIAIDEYRETITNPIHKALAKKFYDQCEIKLSGNTGETQQ